MNDDRLYLIHIKECCERVESYVSGGKEAFLADTRTQDAVLRNLQILAESAKRISIGCKEKHPEIDWHGVISIRNVLVHDYLGLDPGRIWEIVDKKLPSPKRIRLPPFSHLEA